MTFPKEDYIPHKIRIPTAIPEVGEEEAHIQEMFLAHGSDTHEWFWIKDQRPEEVLMIQLFDSHLEKEGRMSGAIHSAVTLEATEREDARESVEVRIVAVWD